MSSSRGNRWRNIDTDQLEATVIPATRLNVADIAGAVPAEQTVTSSANIEELLAAAPVVDQDMIDAQAEAEFIEVDASWLNFIIGLAFLIVAASIYQLVIAPNRHVINDFVAVTSIEAPGVPSFGELVT